MQLINDWDIILLKKQKSYALAALNESRGKVLIVLIFLKSTKTHDTTL
jgi:hypothetical protein